MSRQAPPQRANLPDSAPSQSHVVRRICFSASLLALASVLLVGAAAGGTSPVPDAAFPGKTGFLAECGEYEKQQRQFDCYARRLLAIVEHSGDPARELPRIDGKVHHAGGFLEAACHSLMHVVGRAWARRHHLTLEDFNRYVPRSNDPGCSAGFGMGLVMYLGTRLVLEPRSVLSSCTRLPTRFREYTCIHGTGHALMRGYHGQLTGAVRSCSKLGSRFAPDCAQGAFHDYWISLSGGDGTTRPEGAETDPKVVCGLYAYPRPCWYRFFWERMPRSHVYHAADITRLCSDLPEAQRGGCIAGASLSMSRTREPVEHARTCAVLGGADALNCIRGVVVAAVANRSSEQRRLIRTCAAFPKQARSQCYAWFGRTLAVVTDGRFLRTGCPRLYSMHARSSCIAGARRTEDALATFS